MSVRLFFRDQRLGAPDELEDGRGEEHPHRDGHRQQHRVEGLVGEGAQIVLHKVLHGVVQGAAGDEGHGGGDQKQGGRALHHPGQHLGVHRDDHGGGKVAHHVLIRDKAYQQVHPPGHQAPQTGQQELLPAHVKEHGKAQGAQKGGCQLHEKFRVFHISSPVSFKKT